MELIFEEDFVYYHIESQIETQIKCFHFITNFLDRNKMNKVLMFAFNSFIYSTLNLFIKYPSTRA